MTARILVRFVDGPWAGQEWLVPNVCAPVYNVGHEVGQNYWLDVKGKGVPTYYWFPGDFDGAEAEAVAQATPEAPKPAKASRAQNSAQASTDEASR